MAELGSSPPDGEVLRTIPKVCDLCKSYDHVEKCSSCGTGLFCGVDCWERARRHGLHECNLTTTTPNLSQASIWSLVQGILTRTVPEDERTRRDYRFDRCGDDPAEKQRLLVVYQDILLGMPNMTARRLHGWMEAKQLHKNMVHLFNRHTHIVTPQSFMWLYLHKSVFEGEDTSTALRLQEYLERKKLSLGQLEECISLTRAFV